MDNPYDVDDYSEWTLIVEEDEYKRLTATKKYGFIVALFEGGQVYLAKRRELLTAAELEVCITTNRAAGDRAMKMADYYERELKRRENQAPAEVIDILARQKSDKPQ